MQDPGFKNRIGGSDNPEMERRVFLAHRGIDTELSRQGKKKVREVFKPLGSGGVDRFVALSSSDKKSFFRRKAGQKELSSVKERVFETVWENNPDTRIEFTKHQIPITDTDRTEYLEFGGLLEGLRLVEVEFSDEASAEAFVAPECFDDEVTGDPRYSNEQLALHGAPSE